MFIEKLHISRFGHLQNFECNFSNGMNLIEGPNESGKSTIVSFIRFMLFDASKEKLGSVKSDYERYVEKESDSVGGGMLFSENGVRYKLVRFASNASSECSLYRLSDGNEELLPLDDEVSVGRSLLGVNVSLFSETALVPQCDLSLSSAADARKAIENLVLSGSERRDPVTVITHLSHEEEKIGEQIRTIGEKIDQKSSVLSDAKRSVLSQVCKGQMIEEVENELREKREELQKEEACVKKTYAIRVLGALDELDEKKSVLESALGEKEAHEASFRSGKIGLPDENYEKTLTKASDTIVKSGEELAKIENRRQELESALSEIPGEDAPRKIYPVYSKVDVADAKRNSSIGGKFSIVFWIFSILFTVLGAVLLILPSGKERYIGIGDYTLYHFGFVILLFAVLIFVFSIVLSLIAQKNRDVLSNEKEREEAENARQKVLEGHPDPKAVSAELADLDRRKDELGENVQKSRETIRELFDAWGQEFDERSSHIENAQILSSRVREFLSQENFLIDRVIDAQKDYDSASAPLSSYTREGVEKELAAYTFYAALPDDLLARSEARVDELKKDVSRLENTLSDAQLERANVEGALAPAEILEAISDLQKERIALQAKLEATRSARTLLEEAKAERISNMIPAVEERAGQIVRRVSAQRYEKLVFEGEKRAIKSVSGIKDVDFSDMSAGTSDMAYISLRLALIPELYLAADPPIILDEAFGRMDDQRLEAVLDLICELAGKRYQVLMLSCQEREGKILSRIGDFKTIKL